MQAAVEAVAKEKFKESSHINESSHIDRADLQTFLDAISVEFLCLGYVESLSLS